MKTFRVGICSSDPDYSVGLMDYVNSDTSLGINAVMFSSMLSHLKVSTHNHPWGNQDQ